ncbi:MAG: SDR family oxidoreductase [Microthrixaceae bacterium]|nr:SDR family oxidoreductase [Microthrixaceae bacterium]
MRATWSNRRQRRAGGGVVDLSDARRRWQRGVRHLETALVGLVRALAVSLGHHQIRVNALLPGWTKTELAGPAYDHERFRNGMIRRTPLSRWAEPSEMSAAAVFLCDPATSFHTGDALVIDGGYTVF